MAQIKTVRAGIFEDTIDGYFPLLESLRQMLVRNRFDATLIRILHAPAMEIPGLKPRDPVPFTIDNEYGCMIHQMTLMVHLTTDEEVAVSGAGQWTWNAAHRVCDVQFSPLHRLAEPAFIRGIHLKNLKSDPSENAGQPCVLLHTGISCNRIVQGGCSAVDDRIIIKPLIPDVHQEQITRLVFEKEQLLQRKLHEIFNEL